jgi:hypothetical protein
MGVELHFPKVCSLTPFPLLFFTLNHFQEEEVENQPQEKIEKTPASDSKENENTEAKEKENSEENAEEEPDLTWSEVLRRGEEEKRGEERRV